VGKQGWPLGLEPGSIVGALVSSRERNKGGETRSNSGGEREVSRANQYRRRGESLSLTGGLKLD